MGKLVGRDGEGVLFRCGGLDFEGEGLAVGIAEAEDLRDFMVEGAWDRISTHSKFTCYQHGILRLKPSSTGSNSTEDMAGLLSSFVSAPMLLLLTRGDQVQGQ